MILDIFNIAFVFAEEIDYERLWSAAYLAYKLFEIVIGVNGKNGSENFFFHDKTIFVRFFYDGW